MEKPILQRVLIGILTILHSILIAGFVGGLLFATKPNTLLLAALGSFILYVFILVFGHCLLSPYEILNEDIGIPRPSKVYCKFFTDDCSDTSYYEAHFALFGMILLLLKLALLQLRV